MTYKFVMQSQISAHEHLQRQMMMDRERFPHPGGAPGGPGFGPHPSFLAQQEEYLRYMNMMMK